MTEQFLYSLVALFSASAWALGAVLWRKLGDDLTAAGMNFAKVLLGSCLLTIPLLLTGLTPMSLGDFLLLGASGLLGIAIGDTFFFMSLLHLGPRRASLMGCLNPVLIALASFAALGERPAALAWVGILATTSGVSWVLYERTPNKTEEINLRRGVLFGGLSILCTTASVLMAKVGVLSTPSLQATVIRLVWAVAGMLVWGLATGRLGAWTRPLRDHRLLARVVLVVMVVVFGGFWLSLLALKHIDASIAGTLNSTAPLLILPMVVIILKEKISHRAILGALVAVAGISLIMVTRAPEPREPGLLPPAEDIAWRLAVEGRRAEFVNTDQFVDLLDLRPGIRVVDIGAGTGRLAFKLAGLLDDTSMVYATEIEPHLVELMNAEAKERGLANLRAVEVTKNGLDPFYLSTTFDLVIITNSEVARVVNRDYFTQLARTVANGGHLIVRAGTDKPVFPDFIANDFADLDGMVEALASEPSTSPFYTGLRESTRALLNARDPRSATPAAVTEAVLADLNAMMNDLQFGRAFTNGQEFIDSEFSSEVERNYAEWLLLTAVHSKLYETAPGDNQPRRWPFAQRLNCRLIVRRFRDFLVEERSSPYWPGRPGSTAYEVREQAKSKIQSADWLLMRELYIIPFQAVYVFESEAMPKEEG